MIFSSKLIEDAVKEFSRLPGIGKKTALRMVLQLLRMDENEVDEFTGAVSRMRHGVKFCKEFIKNISCFLKHLQYLLNAIIEKYKNYKFLNKKIFY